MISSSFGDEITVSRNVWSLVSVVSFERKVSNEQGVGDSHSNKVWKLDAGGLSERANRALCVWSGA